MTTTTTRRQTPTQARKAALESGYTPLYAAAGLTDLMAESLIGVALATTKQVAALQTKGTAQARLATEFVKTLPVQVKTLPGQFKTLPELTKARITDLEQQGKDLLAEVNMTYGDLAGRGKRAVDDTMLAARKTTTKAKADVEVKLGEVRDDVAEAVDPAFEAVQEGVTKVRQTVTGKTVNKPVTEPVAEPVAEAATAKPATAKAAPARKPAARKAPTKPAATRKAPAKKAPVSPATAS